MKHSVCAATGSRAELGLLRPPLLRLNADGQIDLRVVETGSHPSRDFGSTEEEILSSGLPVRRRISFLWKVTAS